MKPKTEKICVKINECKKLVFLLRIIYFEKLVDINPIGNDIIKIKIELIKISPFLVFSIIKILI